MPKAKVKAPEFASNSNRVTKLSTMTVSSEYSQALAQIAALPDVTPLGSGKVRDLFRVGSDALLLVASDRVSAFDEVLPTPIPGKGEVLTKITVFWLDFLGVPNHLISTDPCTYGYGLDAFADVLAGRSMLCKRAEVIPIECVARGYLVGSGWAEYQATGAVCGVALPEGLQLADRLPNPIFTPAYKAPMGKHDENITFARMVELVGEDTANALRDLTLDLYTRAAAHCEQRGIILADTKFEFGLLDGQIILIDEVCTPDSSRFWPADGYEPGRDQASFDKQVVRDWVKDHGTTDPLPEALVAQVQARYAEAHGRLTAPA